MKKVHLFAIIVIAVAIAVIMSTSIDASSYVSFKEATELSAGGKDKKVHVVGTLKKDPAGQIVGMHYQPQLDANHFEFVLVDQNNEEHKVVYNQPKPQDFERSEQIVVVGSMQGEAFKADKIVMKCPSKYQENEIKANGSKGVEAKL